MTRRDLFKLAALAPLALIPARLLPGCGGACDGRCDLFPDGEPSADLVSTRFYPTGAKLYELNYRLNTRQVGPDRFVLEFLTDEDA